MKEWTSGERHTQRDTLFFLFFFESLELEKTV